MDLVVGRKKGERENANVIDGVCLFPFYDHLKSFLPIHSLPDVAYQSKLNRDVVVIFYLKVVFLDVKMRMQNMELHMRRDGVVRRRS
jgi:hypothetical protein